MARQNLLEDLVRQYTSGLGKLKRADPAAVAEVLAVPGRIIREFYSQLDEVAGDRRLTEAGKADARREAGCKTLSQLRDWHGPLSDRQKKAEEVWLSELFSAVAPSRPTDVAERIEKAFLRHEVRQTARGMSTQELEITYRQGDANVRQALEELPSISKGKNGAVIVKPFVSDELRKEVLIEAGRRAKPDIGDQLDDLVEVREMYRTLFAVARREISEAAPGAVEPELKLL